MLPRGNEMTYNEFKDQVKKSGEYEVVYEDSEGRLILIIAMIDAYGLIYDCVKKEMNT